MFLKLKDFCSENVETNPQHAEKWIPYFIYIQLETTYTTKMKW